MSPTATWPGPTSTDATATPPTAERLSLGVAARLSRYLQVLTQAKKMGKETISSQELSRLHARQLDADPPRPVGLRQVRQARGRLQRRLAGLADPQDPAHRRASTTSRCSAPATSARRSPSSDIFADHGFRVVAIFDTDPRQGRRRRSGRRPVRHADDLRAVVEDEDIVVGVLAVPDRGGPGARRRARRRRREDHLQLLRGAAPGAAGGDGAHLEPGRRPALRAVLLPDLVRPALRSPSP